VTQGHPALQVRSTLESVLGPKRALMGQLPVLLAALGAAVKEDRARAWPVYRAFRTLYAPNKIGRWLRRWGAGVGGWWQQGGMGWWFTWLDPLLLSPPSPVCSPP